MGASNYPGLSLPKPTPRVITKLDKRRSKDAALREAYELVDERDGGVCWVTGVKTTPFAKDAKYRREHHHLLGRTGRMYSDANHMITVSAYAHELLTKHVLQALGTDARRAIKFAWNRDMLNGRTAPFRLRRQVDGERAA